MSVFTLEAALAAPARAEGTQKLKYDVYAGGFHVVSADLTVDLSNKTNYFLRLGAYTHGMLARLAPWSGVFETTGWHDAKSGAVRPQIHKSVTTWRNEDEIKEYLYNRDGTFRAYRVTDPDPENDGSDQEVDKELTHNTTDALSATLLVMQKIAETGKCEGSEEVFDGKRRYRQVFVHQGEVTLEKSRLNAYEGPATECTVEVKPVAGKWREKPRGWMSIQEQGRAKGTMPTVWFAKLSENEPAVPVRIRVKTDYGTLFMHMTHYAGGQKEIARAR